MKTGSMVLLAGALLLGGCTQGTVIANRDQVVLEDYALREAVTLAEQRCGRFGRRAYFESEGRSTLAFTCREPRGDQAALERSGITPSLGGVDVRQSAREASAPETADSGKEPSSLSGPENTDKGNTDPIQPEQKISQPEQSAEPKTLSEKVAMATPLKPRSDRAAKNIRQEGKPRLTGRGQPGHPNEIKRAGKGTIWVQVASSGKETEAQDTAHELIAQHADVIGTSTFNIQRASLKNAGIVYRTRVGPYKRFASANNACKALKTRKLECLVVIR